MPRPERPLDANGDELSEFAAGLRELRDQTGRPGYRKLAQVAHYSATTLAEAAGGRVLPSLAVTLAYVRACGGDAAEWERRWHTLAAHRASSERSTEVDAAERAGAPYVGLAAFEPDDAERFFGRTDLTEHLVRRVREHRFVTVFGASGTGKSSVLRAGLVARMRHLTDGQAATPVVLLTPGPHPLEECAVALAPLTGQSAPAVRTELLADPDALHLYTRHALADRPTEADLLLVVDQFEEVFTLCHDEQERRVFVTALVRATQQPTSRLRVVLGVRTDFYTHCARIPDLAHALGQAQILVEPMSTDQLRSAITQPAVRAGCTVESALLAALIADCAGQPAVLPLLSHALLETWRRRRGNTLTLAGYQAAGGITHAITHTAERVYAQCDIRQQRLVESLLLRLTALGEGTEDTKRRIHRDELDAADPDRAAILERLTQARLITVDREWIEITHEALIRSWPRLQGWMDADREGLRIHRQLTEATATWLALDRDPDALYRGSRLLTTQEWHTTTDHMLNPQEREFLAASLAAQARDRKIARRRTRRLRQLVALLSVLLVVATTMTVIAVRAGQTAAHQRDVAIAENVLNDVPAVRTTDPGLALQLTLAAYRLAPDQQTTNALLNALTAPHTQQPGHGSDVVALSRDGRLMATSRQGEGDRTVRIWDLTNPRKVVALSTITGLATPIVSASFSPDARTLTLEENEDAQLWDVTRPGHPHLMTALPDIATVVFDAHHHLMATVGIHSGVQVWDSTNLRQPVLLATLPTGQASTLSLNLSNDGRTLAVEQFTGGLADHVQLWDLTNPRQPTPAGAAVPTRAQQPTAFSPTSLILAIATDSGATLLWDISNPHQPRQVGSLSQADPTNAVAFSADGQTVATGASTGALSLWNINTPSHPRQISNLSAGTLGIKMITFRPDESTLAVVTAYQAVELITIPQFALAEDTQSIAGAIISPDGHTLATIDSMNQTGSSIWTQLWDLTDLTQPTPAAVLSTDTIGNSPYVISGSMAFNPNGTILATNDNQHTYLWDLTNRQNPRALATLPEPATPIAFSSDGHVLATDALTNHGDHPQLWDVSQPNHPRALTDSGALDSIQSIAFSPHGHILAMVTDSGSIQLWDSTNVSQMRLIATMPSQRDQITTLTIDPSGRTLAASVGGLVRLWNVGDPAHPTLLTTLPDTPGPYDAVAFSPDGHTLAITASDQTIQLWDLTDPTHPTARATITNAMPPMMFHPDGHTLLVQGTGTHDSLELRETNPDNAAAQICAISTTSINRTTWNRYFPAQPYQPPCP